MIRIDTSPHISTWRVGTGWGYPAPLTPFRTRVDHATPRQVAIRRIGRSRQLGGRRRSRAVAEAERLLQAREQGQAGKCR
jgi:hypothetical protein